MASCSFTRPMRARCPVRLLVPRPLLVGVSAVHRSVSIRDIRRKHSTNPFRCLESFGDRAEARPKMLWRPENQTVNSRGAYWQTWCRMQVDLGGRPCELRL